MANLMKELADRSSELREEIHELVWLAQQRLGISNANMVSICSTLLRASLKVAHRLLRRKALIDV